MSNYKEFQGKSLDEAIQEACKHFDLKRDKLEVEIVSGGSTGIFGLVGAKPAVVKARPRNAGGADEPMEERAPRASSEPRNEPKKESVPATRPEAEVPARQQQAQPPAKRAEAQPPAAKAEAQPPAKTEEAPREQPARESRPKQERKPQPKKKEPRERRPRPETPETLDDDFDFQDEDDFGNRQPQVDSFADINKEELELTVREVTITLIEQLVMAPKLEVKVGKDRVNVLIDEPEHSGLIIGREGQTLSSLQYLVNRIVSRRMATSVRVQIDTGDYRERQDDKLRETAEHLAEKARRSGRTQSTKPLSSYHRRIIHLTLQEDERVFTRSKGEGPMKRVLVVPKKRRTGRGGRDEQGEVNGNR